MQRVERAGPISPVVALLGSTFCSSAGSLAMTVALGKQIYDLTGRDLDLGLLGLAEFAPAALLVLVTGTVADRLDRRRVAATAIAFEAVAALLLAWYVATDPTSTAPIFMLVVGFGVARAFAAPSARSLPADIIGPDRLPWLVARYSATWQVALVVGPVLGGFLYAVDPSLPYLAATTLFALGAIGYLTLPRPAPHPTGLRTVAESATVRTQVREEEDLVPAPPVRAGWHDAVEGLRFVMQRPILLGAISLDLFAVLFGGAVALLPAIATDRLGVGAVALGWLRAAGGIGAAIVTVGLAIHPVTRRIGRVLLVVVAVFGVATIALGVTTSFVVAFVAMAVLSGADAVSVFIRATLVPLATPADRRGRVLAVENVFIGASNELGAFESGVAGELIGTSGAVVLGGAATLAIAGGYWFLFPVLRDLDRFPDSQA